MSAYPQRDVADDLVRRLVRTRESCQRCGRPGTDVAHIIGRRANATRCLEGNLWFLCHEPCHRLVDSSRRIRQELIQRTIGLASYSELLGIAQRGPQGPLRAFWEDECIRLRKRLAEEGLDG